ncbi:MAG: hypothetical protein ACU0DK_13365 [Pseudooceanicola sp.]
MRHVLAILILVLSAWAFLPGAAQAHGMSHDMPHAGSCPDCPEMAGHPDAGQVEGHNCHHGAGCAAHGLPAGMNAFFRAAIPSEGHLPERHAAPRSALVTRDLPPPRS